MLWHVQLHKGRPRDRIVPPGRPDVNRQLLDNPMPVQALQHKDDDSRNQPFVEVRVPVVHTVDEEENVEESHSSPVDDPEGDETSQGTKGLDAAQTHHCEDNHNEKSSDGRELVLLDALPEGRVEGGVKTEGAEVGEEMHQRPDHDGNGDDNVEQCWVLEWKELQWPEMGSE